jgi:hypothetical protein
MAAHSAENGNGASIREGMRALEKDIARLDANDGDLYSKYDGVGKTNWTIVLSALGLALVIAGGYLSLSSSPVKDSIARLEQADRDRAKEDKILTDKLAAIQAFQSALITRIDTIDKQVVVFRELIRRVEDDRVPTREFVIHQAGFASEKLNMQRQIDEMGKKIDAVFPPSKVLEDMTRRLAEIERTAARQQFTPMKPAN